MIKFFGALDITASIFLFLAAFNIFLPKQIYIAFAVYLLLKGVIFIKSFISVIDLVSGVIILINPYFTVPKAILIIVAILLMQKGIFSMFSH